MQEVFRLNITGASRRYDNTVIEQLISLNEPELASLPGNEGGIRVNINQVLSKKGLTKVHMRGVTSEYLTPIEALGWHYVSLATGLQRSVGHRVNHVQLEPCKQNNEFHAIFEYECLDLGWNVIRLAIALICEAFPALTWPKEIQPPIADFEAEWIALQTLASETVLPLDTEAIIAAARQRDIPCLKLERAPYNGLKGDFRIRRNSMLKLGDCAHQLVLDGLLCVDRSHALIGAYHDRMSLIQLSEKYNFPIPLNQNAKRSNKSCEAARATAEKLQYPLVVKPRKRSHGKGVSLDIQNPHQLDAAVNKAQTISFEVLLERYVAGSAFRLLLVDHSLVAVIASDGRDVTHITDKSITKLALAIARGTRAGMLEMSVVTPDISQPFSVEPSAVVDVDFAPRLDRFLEPGSELMQQAVMEFLYWLYPVDTPSQIPKVVITGTNGKTTTSRMTSRILTQSGLKTALCCTDGVYHDDELIVKTADMEGDSYLKQLENPNVQAAVFEAHFGRIARLGFPWQSCDVGVCTNVTGDHVGRIGIETLEDLAALKRSVPDRARHVVLNADDPVCMAMLTDLPGKLLTLTTLGSAENLSHLEDVDGLNICSIEAIDGRDWIVLTENGEKHAVIAVGDIPATHNGAARHNISNAQQAVAATLAAGISVDTIARVLAGFELNIKDTPGRLNIHDNGRYKVILDFAHNPDGVKHLSYFVDGLAVTGRRIISFSVSMLASRELIMATAAASAGHFDIYICWDSSDDKHRPTGEVPKLMRRGIEAQGVVPEAIKEIVDERKALDHALASCRDGDLLVVQTDTGNFEETWNTILRAS